MTYSRLLQSVSAPVFGALLAVSFASLAIPEARAQAQADEGYVEEVLVTARKRKNPYWRFPNRCP